MKLWLEPNRNLSWTLWRAHRWTLPRLCPTRSGAGVPELDNLTQSHANPDFLLELLWIDPGFDPAAGLAKRPLKNFPQGA